MARYIDADKIDFSPLKDAFDRARARIIIVEQPIADVVKVRHGEWRRPLGDNGSGWNCGGVIKQILGCSCCGHFYQNAPYNYCPNCGAKMDGEDVTDNAD